MPLKVWNGSSFVEPTALKVWNGSSWAGANQASIWNGSSWVQFFSNIQVTLDSFYIVSSVGTAIQIASFTLGTDGLIGENTTPGGPITIGTWLASGLSAEYEVYAEIVSGSLFTGTVDQWQFLDENRAWSVRDVDGSGRTCVLNISIRRGSLVLDSTTVTLTAQRQN